jgi:hypothetical protein
MSNPWFRFYSAAIRHPKVAKLPDNDFRLWLNLLAVACENNGFIPPLEDLKHVLNARLDHLLRGIERLISALLIDRLEVGYTPHNWTKKQFISDTSALRVTLHRKKHAVTVTAPDTEQNRTDSDTDKKEDTSYLVNAKDFWNKFADEFKIPKVQNLSQARLSKLKLRLAEIGGLDGWQAMIEIIKGSPHLIGRNDRGWTVFFDWVLEPKNLTKIMEGNYRGQNKTNHKRNSIAGNIEIANAAIDAALEREAQREASFSAEYSYDDPKPISRLQQIDS